MKKIAAIAAVALIGVIVLPSCKKDYTCVCTTTAAGVSSTSEVSLGKQSKKDAEAACSAKVVATGGVTMECKLK